MIIPILVMLHLYESPVEVMEACRNLGAGEVVGCAVPEGSQCHVHMAKPQLGYRADLIVPHEIGHCFFKDTHSETGG
jgi:hypothetical protein